MKRREEKLAHEYTTSNSSNSGECSHNRTADGPVRAVAN